MSNIKQRYLKGYITDEQLGRYTALGVITAKQEKEIKQEKAKNQK